MKTILVPTDFSKNALKAVRYAFHYASVTKSSILLFHFYTDPTSELNIPFTNDHFGKKEARSTAESNMKKLIILMKKSFPKIKPEFFIQTGAGAAEIISFAKKKKADLIIIGSTGQGAIARAFIGSTTAAVISRATCQIIVVPPTVRFKEIKKIVYATDLEKDNLELATEAVNFAREFKAQVTFLHIQQSKIKSVDQLLKDMVDKIRKETKYGNISFYVDNNTNIAKGIEYYIKKHRPQILTMARHNRQFPETIWKVSWTTKMSHLTSIPILIFQLNDSAATTSSEKRSGARSFPVINYLEF